MRRRQRPRALKHRTIRRVLRHDAFVQSQRAGRLPDDGEERTAAVRRNQKERRNRCSRCQDRQPAVALRLSREARVDGRQHITRSCIGFREVFQLRCRHLCGRQIAAGERVVRSIGEGDDSLLRRPVGQLRQKIGGCGITWKNVEDEPDVGARLIPAPVLVVDARTLQRSVSVDPPGEGVRFLCGFDDVGRRQQRTFDGVSQRLHSLVVRARRLRINRLRIDAFG